MSNFGHFSNEGTEYIFKDPETPRPMMNYIWNSRILSGVNQFGGGNGSYGDRASSYIDPDGRGRAILIRNGNRYFYVRDEETGEFWNPGWYPVKRKLDGYTCTHGLGYSIIEGSLNGIRMKAKVHIDSKDPVEIWTVKVKNDSKSIKQFKVYSFVEFSLEGYPRYSEYNSYVRCEFDKSRNMIIAHNNAQERPHEWFDGFIACSMEISGFESSKRAFLGSYGDITAPGTVVKGCCSNTLAVCEDMVGVLENSFLLSPGEEASYHIFIGSANSASQAFTTYDSLIKYQKIEDDFKSQAKAKRSMVDSISIDTPDVKINNIINFWVKQQIQLCAEAGRSTGKGFRDQLQDAWAIAAFDPRLAKEKILETLKYQYGDGRCVRGWLPLDPHIYSDGPTWIVPAVNAYIKETGDYGILDIRVPYLDIGEGTVWEHMLSALRYSSEDTGERNLVLAHDGDWNDSLNGMGVGGKGESVWTSIALYHALQNGAEVAKELMYDKQLQNEFLERAHKIKQAINDTGWDGNWYLAGYNDTGEKVGSHEEKEGSIYLNSQTWAVMTGAAEGERLKKCLKVIDEKLDSPYGPLTLNPPYTKYNPRIGRLTGFVPGIWENGTPYCHGGAFKIVADCCAGRGNDAYNSMRKIIPDSEHNPSDHSGCEPYVFTNMYFGPDNPRSGESTFAWVTGTAGWMFRAVTQYMLGFHPGYETVTIKPCMPSVWKQCSMKRSFRGDVYILTVSNKPGERANSLKISVDGREIQGNSFGIFKDGKIHNVNVDIS